MVEDALASGKPTRILTGVYPIVTGWRFNRILGYYGFTSSYIEKLGGAVIASIMAF